MITMHPGEYLVIAYVDPLNLTRDALAKKLRVSRSAVSRLIAGKATLSAAMALKLEQAFDRSAESWMEMQTQHSLRLARQAPNKGRG